MLKEMWKKIREKLSSVQNFNILVKMIYLLGGIVVFVALLPYVHEAIISYKTPNVDILSIIVDIIFILAAIVLTTEIFTFTTLKREYEEIKKQYTAVEKLRKESEQERLAFKNKCDLIIQQAHEDYSQFRAEIDLMLERGTALIMAALALKMEKPDTCEEAKRKLNSLRIKLPTDRDVIFYLDYLYDMEGDYEMGVNLYSDFIRAKEEKGEFDIDLAHGYFNRACCYGMLYESVPAKEKLQEAIIGDIKNAIRYDKSIAANGSLDVEDFSNIKNEEWFKEILL